MKVGGYAIRMQTIVHMQGWDARSLYTARDANKGRVKGKAFLSF